MVIYIYKNDDSHIEIQAVKRTIRKNKNLRLHKRYGLDGLTLDHSTGIKKFFLKNQHDQSPMTRSPMPKGLPSSES